MKADTAELDKLKVEGQKAIEETEKRAQETEEQSHGNTELVGVEWSAITLDINACIIM